VSPEGGGQIRLRLNPSLVLVCRKNSAKTASPKEPKIDSPDRKGGCGVALGSEYELGDRLWVRPT